MSSFHLSILSFWGSSAGPACIAHHSDFGASEYYGQFGQLDSLMRIIHEFGGIRLLWAAWAIGQFGPIIDHHLCSGLIVSRSIAERRNEAKWLGSWSISSHILCRGCIPWRNVRSVSLGVFTCVTTFVISVVSSWESSTYKLFRVLQGFRVLENKGLAASWGDYTN